MNQPWIYMCSPSRSPLPSQFLNISGEINSLVNYSSQHRFVNLVILNPVHGSYQAYPVIQGVTIMLGLQLCLLWQLKKKWLWKVPCIYCHCVLFQIKDEQDAVSSFISLLDKQCISSLSHILPSFPPAQFLLFCHYQIQVYLRDIVGLVLDYCIKMTID